jgi:hypothetical protein
LWKIFGHRHVGRDVYIATQANWKQLWLMEAIEASHGADGSSNLHWGAIWQFEYVTVHQYLPSHVTRGANVIFFILSMSLWLAPSHKVMVLQQWLTTAFQGQAWRHEKGKIKQAKFSLS